MSPEANDQPGGDHAPDDVHPGGDDAPDDVRDDPGWSAARSVQADFGRLLLEATGGHGLDIAWVVGPDGARVPGLVIHVAADDDAAGTGPGPMEVEVAGFPVTVPGTIELDLFGQAHAVPVRWATSPAATFEGDAPV
ncbi:MAG TPA: hypothetical protein VJ978_00990 [Nitriliruptoraceae bacterium]|nr:hypothetical protein [Nitriliruptoraceae bacterium]